MGLRLGLAVEMSYEAIAVIALARGPFLVPFHPYFYATTKDTQLRSLCTPIVKITGFLLSYM